MTKKTYRSSDITPGAIATLYEMDPKILTGLLIKLVKKRDLDNIEIFLSSETVLNHPWGDMYQHMRPLEDSPDPRGSALRTSWFARRYENDSDAMTNRLFSLSKMDLNYDDCPSEREEIRDLMRRGGDIENPGPGKLTALGNAILYRQAHTTDIFLHEFFSTHPDRLPLAKIGQDVCSFLINNPKTGKFRNVVLQKIVQLYNFNSAESKKPYSKILLKLIEKTKKELWTQSQLHFCFTMLENNMLETTAVKALWNLPNCAAKNSQMPLFLALPLKQINIDSKAIVENFIKNGVKINEPFDNGILPITCVLKVATPEFLAFFLDAGIDAQALQKSMHNDPEYTSVSEELKTVIYAYLARQTMLSAINGKQSSLVNVARSASAFVL